MYKFIGKTVVSTIGLGIVLCGGFMLGVAGLAYTIGKDEEISKNIVEDCKEFYSRIQENKKEKQKEQINDFLNTLKKKTQQEDNYQEA